MGGSDSPTGPKLRIRLKAENNDADVGAKHKRRKRSVSFHNRNSETVMEDSRAALLIECNPPSLRRVELAEVLNIKIHENDIKEDTIDAMSDESIENEEILEYLDNVELEAKRILDKSGIKGKFEHISSKQTNSIKEEYLRSNSAVLSDNDTSSAVTIGGDEENKIGHGDQDNRNSVNFTNRVSSPIIYNNIVPQPGSTPIFLPPQPIQIAPNVIQQPPRTYANSLLLSKEKFSTRAFYPCDPNFNSNYLLEVKPMPESIRTLYSTEGLSENEKKEFDIEDINEKIPIVIPTCSQWFDIDSVHSIEIEMLSPIFRNEIVENRSEEKQEDKSEENKKINLNVLEDDIALSNDEKINEYKLLRNEIIRLYRETPRQYLTVTECRRRIPYTGDVSFLLKLHSYLEFWGLINFQADIKTLPPKARKLRDYRLKDFLTNSNQEKKQFSYISRIDEEVINNPFMNTLVTQCVSCEKPCIYSYYILRAGVVNGVSVAALDRCVWCVRCYSEGRYPPILHSGHFIKVDIPIVSSVSSPEEALKAGTLGIATWTQEEVQKLIEGIEYYGDDWDAISYHVGNKRTPQECVAYFIQLPIEEPFMRNVNPSKNTKVSFPFMDVSNPLMTQIALIASTVNPIVAASAAKSALDKILEIEGYRKRNENEKNEVTVESDLLETEVNGNEQKTSDTNFFTSQKQFLPQFVPKVSSAKWPSSALLGEKGVQQVCSIALENAANRAKELAEWEKCEIKNIMPHLIDNTIGRLELKLKQFKHLQSMVEEERNILEKRLEKIKAEDIEIKSKLNCVKSQFNSKQTLRL